VVLAPTVVRAPRVSAALADFDRRRNAGLGFFITANDIEVRRPYSVTDLMQMAPGVRVILPGAGSPGASPRVTFQRASGSGGVMSTSCEPIAFVDGVRLVADAEQGLQLDQVIPRPQDVYGIEIYRNLTGAPPQYQALNSTCGLILIWTTRGR
jgi:outer membrane cobalamin receptor